MKFNRIRKLIIGGTLTLALLFQSAAVTPAFADEEVNAGEEGAEAPAGEEGEAPAGEEGAEGEAPAEDGGSEDQGGGVAPAVGTIVANNGMYIANSFPDEYLPSGFSKMTVAYQDQNVELASMGASNGSVTLAYLTDATGSYGDFYLCDTTTAEMSDYVRFEGGNDRFIIVLDPGSTEAPEGFEQTALSVNGKSVKAWIYTGEASDDKDKKKKDKDKDEDKEETSEEGDDSSDDKDKGFFGGLFGSLKPVEAYAGELDLGVGSGAAGGDAEADPAAAPAVDEGAVDGGDAGDVDAGGEDYQAEPDAGAYDAAATTAAPAATGGDPDTSEYFLVYAIDQSGYRGFFLYDSVEQTYLRYVDLGAGSVAKLEKASKSAKIRLFIIIGLIILLIVLIIILVNMALSGKRGDNYYDDDDDYEEMKRRVEKKSKRAPRSSRNDFDDYDDDDFDDFDDDDDIEDVKVYNRKPDRRRLAPAQPAQRQSMRGGMDQQPMQRRRTPSQDIDLDDDFSFDFIKK